MGWRLQPVVPRDQDTNTGTVTTHRRRQPTPPRLWQLRRQLRLRLRHGFLYRGMGHCPAAVSSPGGSPDGFEELLMVYQSTLLTCHIPFDRSPVVIPNGDIQLSDWGVKNES